MRQPPAAPESRTRAWPPAALAGKAAALVGKAAALVGKPAALAGTPAALAGEAAALVGKPAALAGTPAAFDDWLGGYHAIGERKHNRGEGAFARSAVPVVRRAPVDVVAIRAIRARRGT